MKTLHESGSAGKMWRMMDKQEDKLMDLKGSPHSILGQVCGTKLWIRNVFEKTCFGSWAGP